MLSYGLLGALAACSSDPPAVATVAATPELQFVPGTVEIVAGGQVTWEFGSVPHNVFFTSGAQPPADIPDITMNVSVSRTFPVGGTYDYECRLHAGMTGQVTVKGSSTGY